MEHFTCRCFLLQRRPIKGARAALHILHASVDVSLCYIFIFVIKQTEQLLAVKTLVFHVQIDHKSIRTMFHKQLSIWFACPLYKQSVCSADQIHPDGFIIAVASCFSWLTDLLAKLLPLATTVQSDVSNRNYAQEVCPFNWDLQQYTSLIDLSIKKTVELQYQRVPPTLTEERRSKKWCLLMLIRQKNNIQICIASEPRPCII